MRPVSKKKYLASYHEYKHKKYFFPLIASVLRDQKDDHVSVNDDDRSTQYYVQYSFGFSQIFGEKDPVFLDSLEENLLKETSFRPGKVRLYSLETPDSIIKNNDNISVSERQRFRPHKGKFAFVRDKGFKHSRIKTPVC